ncbi:MAG TPA: hypothetical protein VF612_09060 [Jatrophihabitans sp.]|uniref:PIN-like domain-containing protein n=1 Tax=Jatrophihabitans sp. TaxID=1932789 RepID=UPI002EE9CA69
MSHPAPPSRQRTYPAATVRYYLDADVLGLAKIVVQLCNDVTYPGDPGGVVRKRRRSACPVETTDVLDRVWIPEVTRHDWLIITRDSNIAVNRAEIQAVRDSRARMVALAGKEAIGTWDQLEVLMSQWRAIQALLGTPGPFIYTATRSRLTPFDLG